MHSSEMFRAGSAAKLCDSWYHFIGTISWAVRSAAWNMAGNSELRPQVFHSWNEPRRLFAMTEGLLFSAFLADSFQILFGCGSRTAGVQETRLWGLWLWPPQVGPKCFTALQVSQPFKIGRASASSSLKDAKTLIKALSCVCIIASFKCAYTKLFMFTFVAWHSRIIQEPGPKIARSEWL